MMTYGYEMQAMPSKNTTRSKHAKTKEGATNRGNHEPTAFDLPSKPIEIGQTAQRQSMLVPLRAQLPCICQAN